MKKFRKLLAGMVTAAALSASMIATSWAAEANVSDSLTYNPERMSWEDDIYIKGALANSSSKYEIFELTDVKIEVLDGAGTLMFTLELDDSQTKVVDLIPGSSCDFPIYVNYPEFEPSDYDLKNGFSTQLICKFKYKEYEAKSTTETKANNDSSDSSSSGLGQAFDNLNRQAANGYDKILKDFEEEVEKSKNSESQSGSGSGSYGGSGRSNYSGSQNSGNSGNSGSSYQKNVPEKCLVCHGSKRCVTCGGSGRYTYLGSTTDCAACHGSGTCWKCNGTGLK